MGSATVVPVPAWAFKVQASQFGGSSYAGQSNLG